MQLGQGARRAIESCDLDARGIERLAKKFEDCLPHLRFGSWRARTESSEGTSGASWTSSQRLEVRVEVWAVGLCFWTKCSHQGRTISLHDYDFLARLAVEAQKAVTGLRSGLDSLVEFGAESVAHEIQDLLPTQEPVYPLNQFIRSLSQETYENTRMSYGVILGAGSGDTHISDAFDNKRFKSISDGFTTALCLDRGGHILGLECLETPPQEGTAKADRPWWAAGLAEAAKRKRGVGLALTRNGDLVVLHGGKLRFTQRGGQWRKWNHAAIRRRLVELWSDAGGRKASASVLYYLYQVALDLSFRRSGGLLVLMTRANRLKHLCPSSGDHLAHHSRTPPEIALDYSLSNRRVERIDRRVVGDFASLDGAVVVAPNGKLLAYGAMTKLSRSQQQGARTRAALAASTEGVALKISSDGEIGIYQGGKQRLAI